MESENKIITDYLGFIKNKIYSRYTWNGAVCAEKFKRYVTGFLKRFAFETGSAHWIDQVVPVKRK